MCICVSLENALPESCHPEEIRPRASVFFSLRAGPEGSAPLQLWDLHILFHIRLGLCHPGVSVAGFGSCDSGANRVLQPDHIEYVTAVTACLLAFQLDCFLGGLMSTAAVERVVEQRPKLDLVPAKPVPQIHEETEQWDPHPLIPVFVAGAVSLILALSFIGSILAWLALRHSGVMAP